MRKAFRVRTTGTRIRDWVPSPGESCLWFGLGQLTLVMRAQPERELSITSRSPIQFDNSWFHLLGPVVDFGNCWRGQARWGVERLWACPLACGAPKISPQEKSRRKKSPALGGAGVKGAGVGLSRLLTHLNLFSSVDYCARGTCVPAIVRVAPAHDEPRSGPNNSERESTSGRSTDYGSGHLIPVFRGIGRMFSLLFSLSATRRPLVTSQ